MVVGLDDSAGGFGIEKARSMPAVQRPALPNAQTIAVVSAPPDTESESVDPLGVALDRALDPHRPPSTARLDACPSTRAWRRCIEGKAGHRRAVIEASRRLTSLPVARSQTWIADEARTLEPRPPRSSPRPRRRVPRR